MLAHSADAGAAAERPRAGARRYDAVLLDLDGTLVDSREDIAGSANAMLEALGLPRRAHAELYGFIGEGVRRLVERAVGAGSSRPGAMEAGVSFFRAHYAEHLLDTTTCYPGVPHALRRLRDGGVALAIVTNKPEALSRTILDRLGLLPLVGWVVGGDSFPERKPDPTPVRHVLDAAGVPAARAILVGDSLVDVETARAAGVALGVVTWGLGERAALLAARPEHVFEAAAELESLAG